MRKTFPLIFALMSISSLVFGQPADPAPCDAQSALQLVEQQAIESKSLPDLEKRINILIRVADYIWESDNPGARKYFSEAFELSVERFKETGFRNKSQSKYWLEREEDYRFIVARAISKRDPEWSKKLVAEILKSFEDDRSITERDAFDQNAEVRQSIDLAVSLLKHDQGAALAIFDSLIKYPLDSSWNHALYRLYEISPEAANRLFFSLLRSNSGAPIQKLLEISAFPLGRSYPISLFSYYSGPVFKSNYIVDLAVQRFYLSSLLAKIESLNSENLYPYGSQTISEAGYAVALLNTIAELINKLHRDLQPAFFRASATAQALLDTGTREKINASNDYQGQMAKSFGEKISALEDAEKKGTLTDYAIVQLILEAKTPEKLAALLPWLDRIKEDGVKQKSRNFYYFTASKVAIGEKRFEDARKFAEMVPQIEHRAVLFFDIANEKLNSKLTKFETLDLLTDVEKTADKAPDSVEKAQVLLGVAFMFEKIDRFNAVNALSGAIKTANKLNDPNLFTENVTQKIEGEDFGVFSSYVVPGFDLDRTFDQISKSDFQTAVSQAQSFSDRYIRTLAILATVKNCRKSTQTKPVKPDK